LNWLEEHHAESKGPMSADAASEEVRKSTSFCDPQRSFYHNVGTVDSMTKAGVVMSTADNFRTFFAADAKVVLDLHDPVFSQFAASPV
jgi:hypothetical protein